MVKKPRLWIAYNKKGLNGIHIGGKDRAQALKYARDIHGPGAQVELYRMPSKRKKKTVYTVYTGPVTEPTVIGRYKNMEDAKRVARLSRKATVVKERIFA